MAVAASDAAGAGAALHAHVQRCQSWLYCVRDSWCEEFTLGSIVKLLMYNAASRRSTASATAGARNSTSRLVGSIVKMLSCSAASRGRALINSFF